MLLPRPVRPLNARIRTLGVEERSGADDQRIYRGDDDGRGSAPRGARLVCYAVTDRGVLRADNQDQFLLASVDDLMNASTAVAPAAGVMVGAKRWLLAVADGAGGHAGGETASRLAVETILQQAALFDRTVEAVPADAETKVSQWLRAAVTEADAALFRMMLRTPRLAGMATTLTVGVVVDDRLFLGHAGDSRAYLLRDGSLRRLTRDHTLLQDMIDSGLLPEESDARSRFRNAVSNAVGGPTQGVDVETAAVRLRKGDGLLFCTDGLNKAVAETEAEALLVQASGDPVAAAQQLVSLANVRGAPDNVTVVVAYVI